MSTFSDSFSHDGEDSRPVSSTRPFDDDGYIGYDPRLPSQRFDAFANFADNESVKESVGDSSPIFNTTSYGAGDDGFTSQPIPETPSPIYGTGGGFSAFSPESNVKAFDEGFAPTDGPILPPPAEMQPEEGFALREWRRFGCDLYVLPLNLS
uniref:Clathrin light chain 2-like n=1 Tax=Nelumbo nucifera TaxID=4432 RepID=A0A822YA97_NELNU|nr:TPA_asm: hypothetical protein HUJ06_029939 [Nelumbo nucifera]